MYKRQALHYGERIKKTEQQVQLCLDISRKEALEKDEMRQALESMKEIFQEMEKLTEFTDR